MAFERFRKGRAVSMRQPDVRHEGQFRYEPVNDSYGYFLYLNQGFARELRTRHVELWFDRARRALGVRPGSASDPDTYKIVAVTSRISLARIAKKYGFQDVFDDRTLPCTLENGMWVFELDDASSGSRAPSRDTVRSGLPS